jgi:PleD family two-component response regulator
MLTDVERSRVLVAARPAEAPALRQPFATEALAAWDAVEAESFEHARFTLQHTPCDVLLVDEGLCIAEGVAGLAWLRRQAQTPLVCLTADDVEALRAAYEHGASVCLPRTLTLDSPALLDAALRRAVQAADTLRTYRRTRETLTQCRRQIDRLVGMLWRTVPVDTQHRWCSPRHVLMRLHEEVVRTDRHGGPLTIAVGEVQAPAGELEQAAVDLTDWMTERIAHTKRRCDVAGQYGLQGFLLLMVHTPKVGGVACCHRLRKALEEAVSGGEEPRSPVRACFGVASLSEEVASSQALLSVAEQQLEAAKTGAADAVAG